MAMRWPRGASGGDGAVQPRPSGRGDLHGAVQIDIVAHDVGGRIEERLEPDRPRRAGRGRDAARARARMPDCAEWRRGRECRWRPVLGQHALMLGRGDAIEDDAGDPYAGAPIGKAGDQRAPRTGSAARHRPPAAPADRAVRRDRRSSRRRRRRASNRPMTPSISSRSAPVACSRRQLLDALRGASPRDRD